MATVTLIVEVDHVVKLQASSIIFVLFVQALFTYTFSSFQKGPKKFVSIRWARNPQYAFANENAQLRFSMEGIS